VFAKLSFIIGDFVRGNPPTAPANQRAYFQGTICRRVRVILTFLLCCKKRAKRGFPIDGDDLKLAVQHLVQCFEMLRSDEVYPKAGNHGVRQDALFILAGLLLPQLDYGITLMDIGIGRLKRHQLGKALSPDGVWLENSFGYHCLIINVLTTLAADLRIAGGPESDFIHDALKRMLPFAEALIKFDGSSPLIGDTAPERHFPTIAAARQEIALAEDREATAAPIALAEFRRDKSTSYFPKAGYFVSHTYREMSQHASSVIFFATLSTPKHKHSDDLSVLFNHGATDLLIDGGTFNKEISDTVRNAARFDPGTHNTFRVNSQGYPLRPVPGMSAAGLAGVWEEAGWAAARGYNQAYPDGRIERTVIHLKAHHAVIVLDRLFSKTSREVLFEQFWHVSPDFSDVQQRQGFSPVFSSKRYGHLLCAFDAEGSAVSIESGSKENPIAWAMRPDKSIVPTPYVRRAITCHAGIAASLFQWSEVPGDMLVTFECKDAETVQLNAKGIAFTSRYQIAKNAVICRSLESDDAALVEMPA